MYLIRQDKDVLQAKSEKDHEDKKTALHAKGRLNIWYAGDRRRNLFYIDTDLFRSFFFRFGDFDSEYAILEVCLNFPRIDC